MEHYAIEVAHAAFKNKIRTKSDAANFIQFAFEETYGYAKI